MKEVTNIDNQNGKGMTKHSGNEDMRDKMYNYQFRDMDKNHSSCTLHPFWPQVPFIHSHNTSSQLEKDSSE